jgi:hypothetical protein
MNKNIYLSMVLIITTAFALRIYKLGSQELRGDEAFSWNYVVNEAGPMAILERIVSEGDPQPPLHYWALQIWTRVFGDSEKMLRLPSVLLSIIVVALIYKFGSVSVSRNTGIGAAILTAVHPFQIWLAQDVRNMYQLAIMFVLIATLNLPGLLRGHWRSWWIYIIVGSLAMYSHYYALFGLLAHGIYMLGYRGQYWHRWGSAMASIALLLLPWAVVIIPVFSNGQLADPSYMAVGDFLVLVAKDFALGPVVPEDVSTWAALIVVMVFTIGVVHLSRHDKRYWGAMLIAWPIMALAGIYAVVLRRSTFNTFYFLLAFPAMYVILVASWYAVFNRGPLRKLSSVFIVIGAGLIGYSLRNYYFVPEWSKNRGLREVAAILEEEVNPGDIFISNFPDPSQDYYFNDVVQDRTMLPRSPDMTPIDISTELNQIADQYQRLWFIPIEAQHWDADKSTLSILENSYVREAEYIAGKLKLVRFASNYSIAAGSSFIGKSFVFGPRLEYAHLSVNGNSDVQVISIGDKLVVSLIWSTEEMIQDNYVVFVHLLDSKGNLLASHDGLPASGRRPTTTWIIGETLLDIHQFQAPTVSIGGNVFLVTGLYRQETGERLKLVDGSNSITVYDLELISTQ